MANQLLPPGTGEVWAIISRKGGLGKTTVTHAVASGMALRGYRVLILEVEDNPRLWHLLTGGSARSGRAPDDSQTVYGLLMQPERGIGRAAYEIDVADQFNRVPSLDKAHVAHLAVQRGWQRPQPMHFVPGSESLKELDKQLAGQAGASPLTRLVRAVEAIRPHFDLVVMDTPPTLNTIQTNATLASQRLLNVMDFDIDSIEDHDRTVNFVEQVRTSAIGLRVSPPEVLGVVYNKYDATFDNDQRLLFAYNNAHEDPETRARRPRLVAYDQLALLPEDRRTLTGSMNKRISMHTWAPTSDLGRAMFDLCYRLEQITGMARHNPVAPAGIAVRA